MVAVQLPDMDGCNKKINLEDRFIIYMIWYKREQSGMSRIEAFKSRVR